MLFGHGLFQGVPPWDPVSLALLRQGYAGRALCFLRQGYAGRALCLGVREGGGFGGGGVRVFKYPCCPLQNYEYNRMTVTHHAFRFAPLRVVRLLVTCLSGVTKGQPLEGFHHEFICP